MPTKGLAALVQLKEKIWFLGKRFIQPVRNGSQPSSLLPILGEI